MCGARVCVGVARGERTVWCEVAGDVANMVPVDRPSDRRAERKACRVLTAVVVVWCVWSVEQDPWEDEDGGARG